jgi:hypothetical protein
MSLFKKMLGKSAGTQKQHGGNGLKKAASDVRHEKTVMKDAAREIYSHEKPEQELGMTDLIKQHKTGERFLYAAVTANQGEEESSRLRRLIQHNPKLSRKSIPVQKLPALPLYDEVETFQLADLLPLPPKGKKLGKTYINISEVLVIYGSLISSDSIFSKVKVSIVDNRLLQNKIAKSYVANTNVISKATMSLSYCFPRDEVDAITLTLSREAAFLEEGRQWGVAQVQITLEETDFPIQTHNMTVRAMNDLPQSMLEERDVNPDFIDISMSNNNVKDMRQMYMDGDLADETTPIVNRTEVVKYAKSSLSGPKGRKSDKPVASGWEFMNDKRQTGIEAGANSVEPSEEGSMIQQVPSPPRSPVLKKSSLTSPPGSPTLLKSAMKKPRVMFNVDEVNDEESADEEVQRETESPRRLVVENPGSHPSSNFLD